MRTPASGMSKVESEQSLVDANKFRAPFAFADRVENAELDGLWRLFEACSDPVARAVVSRIINQRIAEIFSREKLRTVTVRMINGLQFTVDLDDRFGAQFAVGRCNEAPLLSALSSFLPEAAVTVDVGANFGLYSLFAAHASGAEGRVFAFEPLKSAYALFARNIELNALQGRIEALPQVVSAKAETVKFYAAADGSFSGLGDTGRSKIVDVVDVEAVSLDDCPQLKDCHVDFLKVDVEGHEHVVLEGGQDLLKRSREAVVLLEVSRKNASNSQLAKLNDAVANLRPEGFVPILLDERYSEVPGQPLSQLSDQFSGSLVLIGPDSRWGHDFVKAIRESADRPDHDLDAAVVALADRIRAGESLQHQFQKLAKDQKLPKEASLAKAFQKRLGEYAAKSRTLSKRCDVLTARNDVLEDQKTTLEERVRSLLADLAETRANARDAIVALRSADEKAARAERAALLNEAEALGLDTGVGLVKAFRREIQTKRAAVEAGEARISLLLKRVERLEQEKAVLEGVSHDHARAINELRRQLSEARSAIVDLRAADEKAGRAERAALLNEAEALGLDTGVGLVKAFRREIQTKRAAVEAGEARISLLLKRVERLEQEKAVLEGVSHDHARDINELRRQLSENLAAQKDVTALLSEAQALGLAVTDGPAKAFRQEIHAARARSEAMAKQVDALSDHVRKVESEKAQLEKALTASREEVRKFTSSYADRDQEARELEALRNVVSELGLEMTAGLAETLRRRLLDKSEE